MRALPPVQHQVPPLIRQWVLLQSLPQVQPLVQQQEPLETMKLQQVMKL